MAAPDQVRQVEPADPRELIAACGAEWLHLMIRIRAFEELLGELYKRGELVGVVHLSIGQEAVAVGTCAQLQGGDQITSTHRGHHHMVARGLEPQRMLAEILGRADGYCGGKGGSMHVCSLERGAVGANGIVGGGIPTAVGLAHAARELGTDRVAVAFFGDGAANQGILHESLNLAALWGAPVIFVCENNGFTEFTPTDTVTSGPGIAVRAEGYGIPGVVVDGDDVAAVHVAMAAALDQARAGAGPTLLECRTLRLRGHHEGEESYAGDYRVLAQRADPIDRLADAMARAGVGEVATLRAQIEEEERGAIAAALQAAQASPEPLLGRAYEDVFA